MSRPCGGFILLSTSRICGSIVLPSMSRLCSCLARMSRQLVSGVLQYPPWVWATRTDHGRQQQRYEEDEERRRRRRRRRKRSTAAAAGVRLASNPCLGTPPKNFIGGGAWISPMPLAVLPSTSPRLGSWRGGRRLPACPFGLYGTTNLWAIRSSFTSLTKTLRYGPLLRGPSGAPACASVMLQAVYPHPLSALHAGAAVLFRKT